MNWISSLLALVVLWTFAITCIADDNAAKYYREGRGWVTTNFTWLYIGTRSHRARRPALATTSVCAPPACLLACLIAPLRSCAIANV